MDPTFSIGAEGVDTEALVAQIQARVQEKIKDGFYTDPRIARAERMNLENLQKQDDFLTFYLECIRDAVFVDISDFEIVESRVHFSRFLIALKKGIWKLLKFYTYRLWSQQNQVNGILLSALESAESRNREKIKQLESRLAKIEASQNRQGPPASEN